MLLYPLCIILCHRLVNVHARVGKPEIVYFPIKNSKSGMALDIPAGNCDHGTHLITWTYHGGDNQLFYFGSNNSIMSKKCNMALDVRASDCSNGENLIIWPAHGGKNQAFDVRDNGSIVNTLCGKAIDMYGSNSKGRNLNMWDYHGGWNQIWDAQPPIKSEVETLAKFDFHPFVDSGGGDIGRLEGGVENYAKVCSSNSACLGFNSNGWYKHVLKPKSQWRKWTSDPKRGFYTKKTEESSLAKFDFHPFVDSGGGDIGRLEGGVENYAKVCSSNSACLGFNSNGWYKNVLKPKSQWRKWTSDPKRGFYTKKTEESSLVNARANSCEDNEYEVKGVGCLPKLDRGGKTMVYMHQKKSIKTADHQALAEDCGGHLASVLSNTEQKQMDDMKISGSLLIGLTQPSSCRSEPKGCWTWDDGSTYSYSHWHSGEPNDSGNAEDCVEANWVDLNWNDLSCSASRQAVYILPTDFTKNKACEWYIKPERLEDIGSTKISKSVEGSPTVFITQPSPDYILRFTIKPLGVQNGWASIIHFTTGTNGSRLPGIWFWPGTTKLHIITGTTAVPNEQNNVPFNLKLNEESMIEVRVFGSSSVILVNGKIAIRKNIGNRAKLDKVKVYVGDPWYPASNAIISDISFNNYGKDDKRLEDIDSMKITRSVEASPTALITQPSPDYILSFTIKPLGVQNSWTSIIHFTTGTNGSRLPGIWFWPGTTKLHIITGTTAVPNEQNNVPFNLKLNEESMIEVRVFGSSSVILVNGKIAIKKNIGNRAKLDKVKVYVGDPWYPASNAIISDISFNDYVKDDKDSIESHVWGVNSADYIYYRNGENGTWINIGGRLKQVSVSCDDSHVWGVNKSDYIYYRNGKSGSWTNIGGRLKQVSVSCDGSHVWGVNSADYIYYRNGKNGSWMNIGGRLKQVEVSRDGSHVWGVNKSDYIYYRNGKNGSWTNIGGRLKQVSVSCDGSHVWGVNKSDYIYYRNGKNGSWTNIGGRLRNVSVSCDGSHVWGVNSAGYIYYRNGKNGSWINIGGRLKQVSVESQL